LDALMNKAGEMVPIIIMNSSDYFQYMALISDSQGHSRGGHHRQTSNPRILNFIRCCRSRRRTTSVPATLPQPRDRQSRHKRNDGVVVPSRTCKRDCDVLDAVASQI
jgi:hypothetical protein